MDITKLTETELKALAFDQLVSIERGQMNIKAINEELASRGEQDATEKGKK